MKALDNSRGFTLLEIVVVIIIVGVLASIALPRSFAMVEYSRSTEALTAISAIRQGLERCYLQRNGTYAACTLGVLDIDNPSNTLNAHFSYAINGQDAAGYVITATRNTLEGGTAASKIHLTQDASSVTRYGEGVYSGIQ